MKQTITLLILSLALNLSLSRNASAGNQINPSSSDTGRFELPVDSPKKEKEPVPPAPPAPQMLTFLVSSITCKMTLNGYTQARFQYYTDTITTHSFDIRRARLDLKGNPVNKLSYRLQVEFTQSPVVRIMDATLAYAFNPYLKIIAGQTKIPFSLENITSSYNMESINRSQVVEALVSRSKDVISTGSSGNNNGRDIGIWANGAVRTTGENAYNLLEYSVALLNGNGINKLDNNRAKDFSGRLLIYPLRQLSIGGSYYKGEATYGTDVTKPKDRDRFGFEVFYNTPRFTVKSEFIQGTDSAITRNGYYVQAAGFIVANKLEVVMKYDSFDPNTEHDNDRSVIYQPGLNWHFSQFCKLQLAYDYKREEGNSDVQKDNDIVTAMFQSVFLKSFRSNLSIL